MNNACPSCGAVYAVTTKDVGRKLKCKKCSSSLMVTDAGLIPEIATATANAPDFDSYDAPGVAPRNTKRYSAGQGDLLRSIGGLPTILFGIGIFLVVVFYFMPRISDAAINRATGSLERIKLEEQQKIRKLQETKDPEELTPEAQAEQAKEIRKIRKEYRKPQSEATDEVALATISKQRSEWLDRYGLMFGFLFLSFGCIGFVRSEQNLVVKIVGAAILVLMMILVFGTMSGCRTG